MPSLTETAAALELDALEYPEERGEILLDAASTWRRVGDPDRARMLLEGIVADGGDDAGYARVELAELDLDAGDVDAATAWLAALARDVQLNDGHCLGAAELLAEKGDPHDALRWFDRLVAHLSEDDLAALDGPDAWVRPAATALRQRRDLRERMGLPPDDTDLRTPEDPFDTEAGLAALRDRMGVGASRFDQRRVLIFQRAEHAEAARRWPDHYDGNPDHFRQVEHGRRAAAEGGVANVRLVPGIVADLADYAESTGSSPTDTRVRSDYSRTVPESRTIAWPPGRNSSCWCGSGT